MPNTRLDPEPQPHHGPGQIDLSRGHEHSDIRLGGFIKFVAWLAGVSVIALVICWVALFGLDRMETAERRAEAVRPIAQRRGEERENVAINSSEGGEGETSLRPTPLQPSPGHPRVDWKDMLVLRDREDRQLDSLGLHVLPKYELETAHPSPWAPRRAIPPLLVESMAGVIQNMKASTRPATQPATAPSPDAPTAPGTGGGS